MDNFSNELDALVEQTEPSAGFVERLDARLRAAHPQARPGLLPLHRAVRALALAAAVQVVAVVTVLTVPPLRSLAQEVLTALFSRAASDTVLFETPVVVDMSPTAMVPMPSAALNTDFARVEAEAGFAVLRPTFIPVGFALVEVSYDRVAHLVSQTYMRGAEDGFNLVQTPLTYAEDLDVGASAEIVTVKIGDYAGEYVEGGWRVNPQANGDSSSVTITQREWDADFPFQQMRWVQGNFVLWMTNIAGQRTTLALSDWLAIAASLR